MGTDVAHLVAADHGLAVVGVEPDAVAAHAVKQVVIHRAAESKHKRHGAVTF